MLLPLLQPVARYGARPHWGEMWGRVFTSTACPIRDLYPHFKQQLKLQQTYDPERLFETSLMTAVIAGGKETQGPACTMRWTATARATRIVGLLGCCAARLRLHLCPHTVCACLESLKAQHVGATMCCRAAQLWQSTQSLGSLGLAVLQLVWAPRRATTSARDRHTQ